MAILGRINPLKVVKEVDFGLYLDGGSDGEILLPKRYIPEGAQIGDTLSVFVYKDSEDRLVATTETPLAQVGSYASLRVTSVTDQGAFLDWGLMKDLFVPHREQREPMEVGQFYPVFVYVDYESQRITASSRLDSFFEVEAPEVEEGQEVDIIVFKETDLGWKVVVDQRYSGMLYHSEIFLPIQIGQTCKAYVKRVRPDHKLDLILQKPGFEKVDAFSDQLHGMLKEADGFLSITDKTPAETIYEQFSVSKKTFKKAVGDLYRKRLIVLEETGIRLVK